MILTNGQTKSRFVEEVIEQQISEGKLRHGERLQSVRGLSNQFEVSISVIQSVLNSLEEKGLIERKHGSGVYVRDHRSTPQRRRADDQILLSIHDQGHVYEELAGYLRNDLIERGLLPITIDHYQMLTMGEQTVNFSRHLKDILASGLKGVILDGNHYWRHQFMKDYPGVRTVFMHVLDYPGPMPERAVVVDLEQASYLATAHLAQRGRKKIMLCTFKPDPLSLSPETITRHHSTQLLNGYERALREYDLVAGRRIFYRSETVINAETFQLLMRGPEAPDAIVCDLDYQAMQWVTEALKFGLKVPDDLMVSGMNNTPWTSLCQVPLTSVSFNWKDLAAKAAELVVEDHPKTRIYYLKPQLVERESTGGKENE